MTANVALLSKVLKEFLGGKIELHQLLEFPKAVVVTFERDLPFDADKAVDQAWEKSP